MTGNSYDVIVVGARCAGSPTAMLLARLGYRVLVVDRATCPSDTVSTHIVQPTGVAALQRWGLLDQVTSTGCPAIHTFLFDFGPIRIFGSPGTEDSPVAYCPRRIVLDKILVDAASAAGAEVREGFNVEEILVEDGVVVGIRGHSKGGQSVTERARLVVGADGLHSLVAQTVQPEQYHDKPQLLCGYYSYWSGLPMNGWLETYIRPNRGFAAVPTNDDLTLIVAGWPYAEFAANKTDIEGHFVATMEFGAGVRRTIPRCQARGAHRRQRRTQLLPQAVRPGLGAGRRCRLQQGLHHGAGDLRRVPGRRIVCGRAARDVHRRSLVRRCYDRLPRRPR
jgi:2-polyprenyl-6-methoxyphenol hydroxylase-like FAD-dependent oxidoreductase